MAASCLKLLFLVVFNRKGFEINMLFFAVAVEGDFLYARNVTTHAKQLKAATPGETALGSMLIVKQIDFSNNTLNY